MFLILTLRLMILKLKLLISIVLGLSEIFVPVVKKWILHIRYLILWISIFGTSEEKQITNTSQFQVNSAQQFLRVSSL